jgi:muconolactone delta-isomerase
MTEPANGITLVGQSTEMQLYAARVDKTIPNAYRLVRFRTEERAIHLKLQGYFTWTQGWSQRGGEWKDIETVDADDLADDKPYGPLM